MNRALLSSYLLVLAFGQSISVPVHADGALPLAMQGYDVVAYFVDGKARLGLSEHQENWDERRYQFASSAHEKTFVVDPEHYLPQFAGFCATGVSLGVRVVADPKLWKIIDGKLYVFASAEALDMVEKDPDILRRAQQDWDAKHKN